MPYKMRDSVNSVEKMAADSTGKLSENSENALLNNSIQIEDDSNNCRVENSNAPTSDEGQTCDSDIVENKTGDLNVETDDSIIENSETAQLEGQVETKNEGMDSVENFDMEVDRDQNENQPTEKEILLKHENPCYVYNVNIGQFIPTQADLITENYEGPCEFGLIFPGGQLRAPSIQVSKVMNRVYLRMNTTIAIKFTLDPTKAPTMDLYIRATPRFSSMDSVQFPVDRCKVHSLEDDPRHRAHEFEQLCKCMYYNLAGHVLRSPTHGAIYCFDPISRRHSVLSPLKSRSHDIAYSFHCKSSCPKGIDRRPLSIVFTLEQLNGMVLGQCSLNVKICSCPKRDRDRNENQFRSNASKKNKPSQELNEYFVYLAKGYFDEDPNWFKRWFNIGTTPTPDMLHCGASLLTPSIVQTACHCLASYTQRKGNYTYAIPLNVWEDRIYSFVGSVIVDDMNKFLIPKHYIIFEACRKVTYTKANIYDFAVIVSKGSIYERAAGAKISYAPIYKGEDIRNFYYTALEKQYTCLFMGFGKWTSHVAADGQIEIGDPPSDVLRWGWRSLRSYKDCMAVSCPISVQKKGIYSYRQRSTWACFTSPIKDRTFHTALPGDSGSPVICNNVYFAVQSFGAYPSDKSILTMAGPIAFTSFENALETRNGFIKFCNEFGGTPDKAATNPPHPYKPTPPPRRSHCPPKSILYRLMSLSSTLFIWLSYHY